MQSCLKIWGLCGEVKHLGAAERVRQNPSAFKVEAISIGFNLNNPCFSIAERIALLTFAEFEDFSAFEAFADHSDDGVEYSHQHLSSRALEMVGVQLRIAPVLHSPLFQFLQFDFRCFTFKSCPTVPVIAIRFRSDRVSHRQHIELFLLIT